MGMRSYLRGRTSRVTPMGVRSPPETPQRSPPLRGAELLNCLSMGLLVHVRDPARVQLAVQPRVGQGVGSPRAAQLFLEELADARVFVVPLDLLDLQRDPQPLREV